MTKDIIAGIDIGGTKIAVALADTSGQRLSLFRFPTQVELGPHRILDNAITEIKRMVEEASGHLIAVGVGCGGPLDRGRGLILSPPNLPGWDEFPIVGILKEQFKEVPVLLDNDANAAALGEYKYGAGRGFKNIVYITISTGIGGGIIIGGEIVHGVGDGAGEVGHITVREDDPVCGCGARGCMEAICSGTSIARRAREKLSSGRQSLMAEMVANTYDVTAHTVVEAARKGDALACEIWDETIHYLAIGINNIIATLAPEAVILGGGVATTGEQLLKPLREQIQGRVKILPVEKINILQAALGGDSGIYGALILGRQAIVER